MHRETQNIIVDAPFDVVVMFSFLFFRTVFILYLYLYVFECKQIINVSVMKTHHKQINWRCELINAKINFKKKKTKEEIDRCVSW